ncbi:hypothetical protein R6Q57_019464 [Mikania cordata]
MDSIRIAFQAISIIFFFLLQLPNHVAFNINNKPWLTPTQPEPTPTPTPWPEQFHAPSLHEPNHYPPPAK